jgi:hypothetical protein
MNNSNKVSEVNQILTDKAFGDAVGLKALVKLNQEVSKLSQTMDDIENKRFIKSVELGRLINKAHKVINSTDGINLKQFCEATFGWSINAGMGNKYSRIGSASDNQVSDFQVVCADIDSEWKLTIEDFKVWLSGDKPSKAKAKSNKPSTIFTMTFKREDGNVAVRIDESGKVKTSNSKAEILDALEYLKKCYAEQCAKPSANATTSTIISSGVKVSAEAIEKKALEQARLSEKRSEQVERESIEEKQFKAFYDANCKAEKIVYDMDEYKAWRRAQVLAYREWYIASDENKSTLGAWLSKQAKAIA